MLERATRCLEYGARQASRPSQRTLHSRRMLHSTFWRHGAGDLELPTWCYSIIPSELFVTDLHSIQKATASATTRKGTVAVKFMFFDFLYPGKTLETIVRLSSYGFRRLEQSLKCRSQATAFRRYTSAVTVKHDTVASPTDSSISKQLKDTDSYAATDTTHDALKSLEDLIDSAERKQYREVWSLLSSTPQSHRSSALLARVLKYLSTSARYIDNKRVEIVWDLLPQAERTEDVYSHAIQAYLRFGRFGKVAMLHTTALKLQVPNFSCTKTILAEFVKQNQLQLALQVYGDYLHSHGFIDDSGLDAFPLDTEVFEAAQGGLWQDAATIPDLANKVTILAIYAKKFLRITDFGEPRYYRRFFYNLIYAVCGQALQVPQETIIRMIQVLKQSGLTRPWIYEMYSSTFLELLPRWTFLDVYKLYRADSCFAPSSRFLDRAIQKLTRTGNRSVLLLLLSDWREHHGVPLGAPLRNFMDAFSRFGDAKSVHQLFEDSLEAGERVSLRLMKPILYVHARRIEVDLVEREFTRIKDVFELEPDLVCWNILIHAHTRANNLSEALKCLSRVLDANLAPDKYTLGSIMSAAANRGDFPCLFQLLEIIEVRGLEKSTAMIDALVAVHIKNEDLEKAEQVVVEALTMPLSGSKTSMWTKLIAAFAVRRDSKNALRIYSLMQKSGVPLDSMTYAALMRVLTAVKQTSSADRIMQDVMPNANIPVLAIHYAIVLHGYAEENDFVKVQHILRRMNQSNEQPTISSRRATLQATTLWAQALRKHVGLNHPGLRMDAADEVLKEFLAVSDRSLIATKQPLLASGEITIEQGYTAAYFDVMMHGYNTQKSHDIVKALFEEYLNSIQHKDKDEVERPSINMIRTMMAMNLTKGDFSKVRKYWMMAKKEVERRFPNPDSERAHPMPLTQRRALSACLGIYMKALISRRNPFEALQTLVSTHIKSGYTLSNDNWNSYVRNLVRLRTYMEKVDQPWHEVPFEICESHLMDRWPGWIASKVKRRASLRNLRSPNTEYLDMKFLLPDQNVASFQTLKALRRVLLRYRGVATFSMSHRRCLAALQRIAPRTIAAIDSMPPDIL